MKMINALERYRIASRLSFAEMARLAGFCSRSCVFQHCNGSRNISAESALRYSRAFGIPLSELRPDLWPPQPCPAASVEMEVDTHA